MAEKHPNDKIEIGEYTFLTDGRVFTGTPLRDHHMSRGHKLNLTVNESVNGYKVGRDWDETRDVEGTSLGRKETRHVWEFCFFNQVGVLVGSLKSSSDWLPVPLNMSELPPDWKSPLQMPKAPPMMQVNVPKKVF